MDFEHDITEAFAPQFGLLHRFVGVDLAPNEQLETGFSVLDRDRQLVRMDKLYRDDEIITAIENLGPANGTVVVIDMPKSLSIPGRWRQEEIKMHALRLKRPDGKTVMRYEARGFKVYERLVKMGVLPLLYFNYWTRLNYDMLIPFRSRSPQGCRSLQNALDTHLSISKLPTNLAPSSVLESMVGAYAGWGIWAGKPGVDYKIFEDEVGHRIMTPLARPHLTQTGPRLRRLRKFSRMHLRTR